MLIEIHTFPSKKMYLKMSSEKCCHGLNELTFVTAVHAMQPFVSPDAPCPKFELGITLCYVPVVIQCLPDHTLAMACLGNRPTDTLLAT